MGGVWGTVYNRIVRRLEFCFIEQNVSWMRSVKFSRRAVGINYFFARSTSMDIWLCIYGATLRSKGGFYDNYSCLFLRKRSRCYWTYFFDILGGYTWESKLTYEISPSIRLPSLEYVRYNSESRKFDRYDAF